MEKIEDAMTNMGEKATFIVNIQFCRNSSWQGKVTWVDQKKTSYFRSALELVKLINSAVEDDALQMKEFQPIENDESVCPVRENKRA